MLYVVTGPPCSGKSTYVDENAQRGDVVVDLDRLALAITSTDTEHHRYPAHIRSIAIQLRRQLIAHAIAHSKRGDAYIIHAKPSPKDIAQYRRHRAQLVELTAPVMVLLERAREHRPAWVMQTIMAWDKTLDEE